MALAPKVTQRKELPDTTGVTLNQYRPGARSTDSPLTWTRYTLLPPTLTPSFSVAGLSPEATSVPWLPAETPLRISHDACVTAVEPILLWENTPTTVQPPSGTTKSS